MMCIHISKLQLTNKHYGETTEKLLTYKSIQSGANLF